MDPMNLETRYSKDCSEVEETGKPSTICLPSTKLPVRYADHIRNIPVTNVSSVVHKSGAKLSFWPENELPAKCHDNCGKGVTKEMIEETLDYSRDSVHQVVSGSGRDVKVVVKGDKRDGLKWSIL